MIEWQVNKLCLNDETLWQAWADIVEKHHANNPMLHHYFVKRLVEFFPSDIYVARAIDTVLQATVAIVLIQKCQKGCWQVYKPSQAQAALAVVNKTVSVDLRTLLTHIPGMALKIDCLALDPQEHQSLISPLPDNALSDAATNIKIEVDEDFDNYWLQRIKVLKKNMRRYHNRIDKEQAPMTIALVTEPDELLAAVDRYGMMESRGWKGQLGTALHPGNTQGTFYRRLLKDYGDLQQAIVVELRLGDTLVASRLCVFNDDMFIILKTTYEESYKRFAVGKVLLYHVVKHVFDSQLSRTIDFYTNANRDQIDWSTSQRQMLNATAYRYQWMESLVAMMKKIRQKVR
ncbi:GNAT family N-acetyltransferase [Thalassotalea euphylliae]|uniref:GNAT family N-acetyltransferase n=1 Tax=Thalassotalea euphylliae TaxID=1655234 RepID=UPI00363C6DA2